MNTVLQMTLTPKEKDFEELFKEQFKLVFNYIFYKVRNAMDAEDLTADVFVRAYEYWESYSSGKGSRGEWLGGITRNMVKTYFQKKASKPQIIELSECISVDTDTELSESIAADTDIEGDYLRKEDLRQIFAQMDALPEHQQELLSMKYFLRLTNRDIAKIMKMSESNVGVTLHRAVKEIQKKLKN